MNYWMLATTFCLFGASMQAAFFHHKYGFAVAYLCWSIANGIIFYYDYIAFKGT